VAIGTPLHATTDAECRLLLHWAQSCVNAVCPPGFWPWLEENHPRACAKLTGEYPDRINETWGTSEFRPAIREFLRSLSVAVAVFFVNEKGNADGVIGT